MIVVKKCSICGKNYDTEFLSNEKCKCQQKNEKACETKRQKRPVSNKWDNVPLHVLPSVSNKREKETEAILSVFSSMS